MFKNKSISINITQVNSVTFLQTEISVIDLFTNSEKEMRTEERVEGRGKWGLRVFFFYTSVILP